MGKEIEKQVGKYLITGRRVGCFGAYMGFARLDGEQVYNTREYSGKGAQKKALAAAEEWVLGRGLDNPFYKKNKPKRKD